MVRGLAGHVGGFLAGALLVVPLGDKQVPLFDGDSQRCPHRSPSRLDRRRIIPLSGVWDDGTAGFDPTPSDGENIGVESDENAFENLYAVGSR